MCPHTNCLPIGIIGIVLGIFLIFAGAYAWNYRQLSAGHDQMGMPLIVFWVTPYASLVFPLVVFGLCALVVGIISILYDRTSIHVRAKKLGSSTKVYFI